MTFVREQTEGKARGRAAIDGPAARGRGRKGLNRRLAAMSYAEAAAALRPPEPGTPEPQKPIEAAAAGVRGGGAEVPRKAEMEGKLGVDFGGVRVHQGAAATEACQALGAEAYTMGENVALCGGGADPKLLAHELTHVKQQRGTGAGAGVTPRDAGAEKEARAAESGRAQAPASAGGVGAVSMKSSDDWVASAVAYNESRGYDADQWKVIQTTVGAGATGSPDEATARAVATWQGGNDLTPDGKVGPSTLEAVSGAAASSAQTSAATPEEAAAPEEEGGVLDWLSGVASDAADAASEAAGWVAETADSAVAAAGAAWETLWKDDATAEGGEKAEGEGAGVEEEAASADVAALVAQTRVCTDGDAVLRDDSAVKLDPRRTIKPGSYVRITDAKAINGKDYVLVEQVASPEAESGTELGWTLASNLGELRRAPRPSDPATQMANLYATASSKASKMSGYCYRSVKGYIKDAGGYGDILDIYSDERFAGYQGSAVDFAAAVNAAGAEKLGLEEVPGSSPVDAPRGTIVITRGNGQINLSEVHGDIAVLEGVQDGLLILYNDGRMRMSANAADWQNGKYQGVLVAMYKPVARK